MVGVCSMRVNFSQNLAFCRLLKKDEVAEYTETLKHAKEKAGQTGKSILIMPDISLPQDDKNNTGVGNLASKEASNFFDFIKTYLGINTVELLPHGRVKNRGGRFNIYSGSALSLNDSKIDLRLLTTDEFEHLLEDKEIEKAVKANNFPGKNTLINFENVSIPGEGVDIALKEAFKNFEKLDSDSKLKKEYLAYKKENNDRIFPQAVFEILENKYKDYHFKKWNNELDKNLYNPDFDKELREKRLNEITSDKNNQKSIEFYFFKQFLAEKHLGIGKKMLNDKGLKLYGDVLLGFSADEVWANPKAFEDKAFAGIPAWHIPALKQMDLLDENTPASKMLKKKFQFFAKLYDGLRVDVAWQYVNPASNFYEDDSDTTTQEKYDFGDQILNKIENWVQETKGKDFDKKDIIYEFEASPDDFEIIKNERVNPVLKNRISVLNSMYMGDHWGTNKATLGYGFEPDEFSIGVGNHDSQPLRQMAYNVPNIEHDNEYHFYKENQIYPLAEILKLNPESFLTPTEFIKAKFAEPMMAKNNHVFFMDVFGRDEKYDNLHPRTWLIYRPKLSKYYKYDYEKALKSQHGLNIMDALAKVFRVKGLDIKDNALYKKIIKFRDILYE